MDSANDTLPKKQELLISDRLNAVRAVMAEQSLDAFIVPRADEYLGEYVPVQNERLLWSSGFTGTAGMVIILKTSAAIFVDGRYTIQVRQQVPASLFEFHHRDEGELKWLSETLDAGMKVGIDARLHTVAFYQSSRSLLEKSGISFIEVMQNPIDRVWHDRPMPEPQLAMLLAQSYTGESSFDKRSRIASIVAAQGADAVVISQLDSIAWLLNIRGLDVPRLPVVLGNAVLSKSGEMSFFTDPRKIPNDFSNHVGDGVTVFDEGLFVDHLKKLGDSQAKVMIDKNVTGAFSLLRCEDFGCEVIYADEPVIMPKAEKNTAELQGMRNCHVRDGAALSSFLHWLDVQVAAGQLYDEGELSDKLESFRRQQSDIHDLSFDTISAAAGNGAMCHYNHMNATPAKLTRDSLYLVDSGGQYSDGTTDVTRTVVIGEPSDEHKHMFTLVLKGHIALSSAVFPKGTTGVQLDILARQFLWQAGLDYDHGTGHGVGAFLSVHEGPQRIGKVPTPMGELKPGMVITNEPGFYKEGEYGIRCENVMQISQREDGMMMFNPITFAPFDLRLVDEIRMTEPEILWLNNYHQQVNEKISPELSGEALQWLAAATVAI